MSTQQRESNSFKTTSPTAGSIAQNTYLLELIRSLYSNLELHALHQEIVTACVRLSGGLRAALCTRDKDGALRYVAMHGLSQDNGGLPRFSPNGPLLQRLETERRSLFLTRPAAEPGWAELIAALTGQKQDASWLVLPLMADDRLLAFVAIGFGETLDAPPSLTELLIYTECAGAALRNALVLAEQIDQANNYRLRAELQARLRMAQLPREVLQAAVDSIGPALDLSLCIGWLSGNAGAYYSTRDVAVERAAFPVLQPILVYVARHGQPIVIADLGDSKVTAHVVQAHRETLLATGVRSMLAVPLLDNHVPTGALFLAQSGATRQWTAAEVLLAEGLAIDVGAAIAQAQSRHHTEMQASEAIRERERLRRVLEDLPIGVVVAATDPDEIEIWNRAAQSFATGSPMDMNNAAPRFEVLRADGSMYPEGALPLARALRQEIVVPAERVLLRKQDGRMAAAALAARPLHGAGGSVDGAVATFTDLTAEQQLELRLRRQEQQQSVLDVIVREASNTGDVRTLVTRIGDHVRALIPCDGFNVSMLTAARDEFETTESNGVHEHLIPDDTLVDLRETIVAPVIEHGVPVLVQDLSEEPGHMAENAVEAGIHACVLAPISHEGHVQGVLILISHQPYAFNEADVDLALRIAAIVGLGLQQHYSAQTTRDEVIREERERLAREIHDTLAQTITGVVMQLDSMVMTMSPDAPQRARLEQTRTIARSALAEARRSVWNLRAANMDLQAPYSIMREEIAVLERRGGARAELVISGDEQQVALEIGAVIQRLARVALENITMHSGAAHARILLDFAPASLTIMIEDDGQGFDPDTIDANGQNRVGLAGIAERVRLVGGTLRIESAAGHGTRVLAHLPYSPAQVEHAARPITVAPSTPDVAVPNEPATDDTTATRVLLIDDHTMVRQGLERMLAGQPDLKVIGAEATGADGLRRIAELQPDVVLCDLQLPDMSGVEVIAKTRMHFPQIRCLVVTTYDSDEYIYEGIKAGAKGYVLKDVSSAELVSAVRAAARDESLLQPVVARRLVERFADMARQDGVVEALTEREIEVLKALASGARNKEIAFSLGLSESTIKTHLASIFGKLGVTTRTEAVARGRDLGLLSL